MTHPSTTATRAATAGPRSASRTTWASWRARGTLAVLAAIAVVVACREEAKAPPPEPPKCAKVAKGSDDVTESVLCAGKDADGDGVDDAVDLCPTTAETKNGVHDADGCPDPDRDDDGIADYEDGCPEKAGPPPDGCPSDDSDGDSIPDHLDGCPTKAEDLDGEADSDGCPEGENRALQTLTTASEARIAMQRGRAVPTPQGARDLARLVDETAQDALVVVRVRIVGRAGLNEARRGRAKPLADERAAVVRDAFQQAGLPISRLVVELEPLRGGNAKETGDVLVTVLTQGSASADGGTPSAIGSAVSAADEQNDVGPDALDAGASPPKPADDEWDRDAMTP
jgi:hypothetical protein